MKVTALGIWEFFQLFVFFCFCFWIFRFFFWFRIISLSSVSPVCSRRGMQPVSAPSVSPPLLWQRQVLPCEATGPGHLTNHITIITPLDDIMTDSSPPAPQPPEACSPPSPLGPYVAHLWVDPIFGEGRNPAPIVDACIDEGSPLLEIRLPTTPHKEEI